jgi:hypothetical protein
MAIPQKFSVALNGTAYQLTLHWCDPASCWIMDLADQSGNALISGVPLVTGLPLLQQYVYVGVPGDMFVQTDTNANEVPDFVGLGTTGHLYFVPLATS